MSSLASPEYFGSLPGFTQVVPERKSFTLRDSVLNPENYTLNPKLKEELAMRLKEKMKYSLMLAGIPFLAFPLLAESGMSGDRAQRHDRGNFFSNEKLV